MATNICRKRSLTRNDCLMVLMLLIYLHVASGLGVSQQTVSTSTIPSSCFPQALNNGNIEAHSRPRTCPISFRYGIVDRRNFIALSISSDFILFWNRGPGAAKAIDETEFMSLTPPKPFAALEALLPATQQRHLLKIAHQLAFKISEGVSYSSYEEILQQLKDIFEPPSTLTPQHVAAISMTSRYLLDQKELLSHPYSRLSGPAFRAAMNIYTSNLRFGESYWWNAARSDTKRWIRENGQLPSVQQVITADLDLRDLYRNQVQTRIEDAQAELYKEKEAVDLEELNSLLSEAAEACDNWFQLISDDDIQEAQATFQELLKTSSRVPQRGISLHGSVPGKSFIELFYE